MPTLLLRLAGPLQSWGESSKFNNRLTGSEPTKSGVIGLIASAMGRRRGEPVDDLTALRFGVRVDKRGELIRDYHTASDHNPRLDKELKYVTNRYYVSDAVFVAGIEGDRGFLERIKSSLINPYFPLFLGRRSCPPTGNIVIGIVDTGLISALCEVRWQASDWFKRSKIGKTSKELEIVIESEDHQYYIKDNPVTFNSERPIHVYRGVRRSFIHNPDFESEIETEHDALSTVRGE